MKPIPTALLGPMAIEPFWLRVMFGVWSRGKIDAAALEQAKAGWEARRASRARLDEPGSPIEGTGGTLRLVGDVGVISIEGPLFRHANLITDYSGGTTYDALWRGLEAAEQSHLVRKILFRSNSPGGEADGVSELAEFIASLKKPKWAYVDGMCASAAYWLVSQVDHIVAEQTSESGSIGVRCGIIDTAVADELAGIREIEIISSQSPGKRSHPVNNDVIGRLQTRIDDLAELFIGAVAAGRGVKDKVVLEEFGRGDVMIAAKALDAGLVDEIGNFNGTLAALATTSIGGERSARAKDRTMKTEASAKPAAGDNDGEWQCAGCNEMMGPSAKSYCAKCSEDEPDGDEDEDEAKALGLDPKASLGARRARAMALVDFEQKVLAATGATGADAHARALAAFTEGQAARTEIAKVRADGQKAQLRAALERGLAGAPGEQPRLSLGIIQKTLPTVLRGEPKKAWIGAMDKLSADADEAKSTVTAGAIIEAACSVSLSADDLEAIGDFVKNAPPVAASTHVEPQRNGTDESAEVSAASAEVDRLADNARKVLDRNQSAAK